MLAGVPTFLSCPDMMIEIHVKMSVLVRTSRLLPLLTSEPMDVLEHEYRSDFRHQATFTSRIGSLSLMSRAYAAGAARGL